MGTTIAEETAAQQHEADVGLQMRRQRGGGGAGESVFKEPVMAVSEQEVGRHPDDEDRHADGNAGQGKLGTEREVGPGNGADERDTTMRKRTRYNHCGGSGIMRSTAMMPTNARNGAMYAGGGAPVEFGGLGHRRQGLRLSSEPLSAMVTHRTVRTGRSDELLAAGGRAGVDYGDQAVARVGSGRASVVGGQFAIQGGDELLDLRLHVAHLFAHVQDDLDAGEIDAEIAGEVKDHLQAFQVLGGVEARVAFAARRLEQALALVEAERLRMDLILLRDRRRSCMRLWISPLPYQTLAHISARGSSG